VVAIPDTDVNTPPAAPLTGSINFGADGKLSQPLSTDPKPQLQIQDLKDGASPMNLDFNLFDGLTPRISQYARASSVAAVAQDGLAAAQLVRVGLGDGGTILAQYSNGNQLVVGQLAMATIRNPESLIAVGNNNYQLSARTAEPAIGIPGTGGRGTVIGGAVEASTVDIAREFTNLIVYQRGYEANAKVVSSIDELSQVTIGLKK